jgi:hypothetical protein
MANIDMIAAHIARTQADAQVHITTIRALTISRDNKMKKRVLYVNPNDLIEIRVINDSELPLNKREWVYQVRPRSILIQVDDLCVMKFSDPGLRVELTDMTGNTTKICN